MSIAGGVDRSVDRAVEAGCETMQIFNKSSHQWRARALPEEEVERFRAKVIESRIHPVLAHDSYLINLASPEEELWKRSIDAMVEELERCELLGIPFLVAHPGAHVGSGLEVGIRRIARGLDQVNRLAAGLKVRVLLETTAGQGTTVGSKFSEIGAILDCLGEAERVGVCFDTCHVFAAGYDLSTREGWDATWEEFDQEIGLARLEAFHVNDSKGERGSRLDRHEALGKGAMGLAPFLFLVNDPRLAGRPMVLETPKSKEGDEDRRNLELLRDLVGRKLEEGMVG